MFAPPGVDSSSSGEDSTPPPSPGVQRVKPKFSFKSLFSPTTDPGTSRYRSRSRGVGARAKPPSDVINPVEAAKAHNASPTDPVSPKKQVRIFAGELERGQKAKGLTNNLGENIRDSLTFPQNTPRGQDRGGEEHQVRAFPDSEARGNANGISEEVLLMLRKLMAEQKEAEQAESFAREAEKAEIEREKAAREEMVRKETEQAREAEEYERHRGRIEQRELEQHLESLGESVSTSPIAIRRPMQSSASKGVHIYSSEEDTRKSTDIIDKIRSGASLTKKRSLKSLKSMRRGGSRKIEIDVPSVPVPPIPRDTSIDDGYVMISRTPIADKFARPLPNLIEQGPRTAPPHMTRLHDVDPCLPQVAQGYYHQSPAGPPTAVQFPPSPWYDYNRSPHFPPETAPPIAAHHGYHPGYPTSTMQEGGWCHPPGLPLHPYYPACGVTSQPHGPPVSAPIPIVYASDRSPALSPTQIKRAPDKSSTKHPEPASLDTRDFNDKPRTKAKPHLKDGPGKVIQRQTAQTFDSYHGELGQTSTKGKTKALEGPDSKGDRVTHPANRPNDPELQETRVSEVRQNGKIEKPENSETTLEGDAHRKVRASQEQLEKTIKQFEAKYAEALKVYQTPGLDETSRSQAKERLRSIEAKLKEATRSLQKCQEGTKGKDTDADHKYERPKPQRVEDPPEACDSEAAPTGKVELSDVRDSDASMDAIREDIKRYQSRLAQLRKAYSVEGISDEQKNGHQDEDQER
ncbi:uncharacterized protein I303_101349 [Kwoniella dejecticola CBS 10117]|uniref:Uncharacterized protein n=1 Tax=Kwoniella dejecticola CBS 10117 TaxID=1296121 RepID=A0A1A6AHH8_9TREE|nr:uncharacterized protein I303_01358 [Kwoniella dejecticola CBS 10117]OBR89530.1 hypothetical protein I303_01358 [Kwoniella dejecticola CBS 10117]